MYLWKLNGNTGSEQWDIMCISGISGNWLVAAAGWLFALPGPGTNTVSTKSLLSSL